MNATLKTYKKGDEALLICVSNYNYKEEGLVRYSYTRVKITSMGKRQGTAVTLDGKNMLHRIYANEYTANFQKKDEAGNYSTNLEVAVPRLLDTVEELEAHAQRTYVKLGQMVIDQAIRSEEQYPSSRSPAILARLREAKPRYEVYEYKRAL
jgi:hypothetical protein